MNCSEFRHYIPDIVSHNVSVDHMADLVSHVRSCKDCKDELEIHYVINYGLDDSHDHDGYIDFTKELEKDITHMERLAHFHKRIGSVMILIRIASYATVFGSLIYVIFKFWM